MSGPRWRDSVVSEPDAIDRLALSFRDVLRAWLTPYEFAQMQTRNAGYAANGTKGICASHDFCDANMAMLEALETTFNVSAFDASGLISEAAQDFRSAAWDKAQAAYLRADETDAMRGFLAAQYVARIGYDPFEDDPSISPIAVANTLLEHEDERRSAALAVIAEAVETARRNA